MAKSYGKCPVCKRWIRVTNMEKIFCHGSGVRNMNCRGWGQAPLEIREVT